MFSAFKADDREILRDSDPIAVAIVAQGKIVDVVC
jgi:hypothetical protein